MKYFFLIIGILFLLTKIRAQDPKLFTRDLNRTNIPYGSAKSLQGKVRVVNCFVSTESRSWKAKEKNKVIKMEEKGFEWIISSAEQLKIKADLSFSVSNIGMDEDIRLTKIESSQEPKTLNVNWVPLVLNKAGYSNLSEFYDSIRIFDQVDNICILIFAKSAGRSYAQPSNSNNKRSIRFLEGAVIYSDGMIGFKEINSALIMHEMLHLFGARDIYISKGFDPDFEKIVKSTLWNSIMVDDLKHIDFLELDQLTTWCIGWSHTYWSWYDLF